MKIALGVNFIVDSSPYGSDVFFGMNVRDRANGIYVAGERSFGNAVQKLKAFLQSCFDVHSVFAVERNADQLHFAALASSSASCRM